MFILIEIAEDC